MPSPHPRLSVGEARDILSDRCFSPESPCQVGVELEWLTVARDDRNARVDPVNLARAVAAAGPLPGGSTVTFEPGGQLEVSSPPFVAVGDACAVAETDTAVAQAAAVALGIDLVGLGADPLRPPQRVSDSARYRAMEAYFDTDGPAGRRMMANTASVQVNIGVGPTLDDATRQWRLAHRLGPTLAAAFANSPLLEGRPTGFHSARLATWMALDRSRATPVDCDRPGPEAWADYVLDARVMLIRPAGREAVTSSDDRFVHLDSPLTFGQWVTEGHELGWPTSDDLDYHLSTLFPPVRPRGWLELRMLDALPDPWWQVPVAVTAGLLADPEGGDAADRAATSSDAVGRWVDAARTGLGHPALAASARDCFRAALASLDRLGASAPLVDMVAAYTERWVDRARTPADDRLDAWADHGALFPEPAEVGA
ncbi:MAG: glutamate-cysteine ligase family protein [Actinomycetota bacterium]|nr:glutamate-cysteine ligase family protein [Actinomycetota bacterium]